MARREKTAVRRQQIVDSTLHLLAEVPLAELTTRRIARALGLSQPALFRHFTSREALLLAVLDHARGDLATIVAAVVSDACPKVGDRLVALARGLFAYIEAHPGLPRLLFADLGPSPAGAALRDALRQLVGMQRGLVAELVRDGQRDGALRADLDPDRAATFFVGLVQGAIVQWELADRATPLALDAEPLARLWLEGATPRGAHHAATQYGDNSTINADIKKEINMTAATMLRSLDVRPSLARGVDPLSAILAEVAAAGPTGLVCVTAPFHPTPLLALLSGQGHSVTVREGPPRTWSVTVVVGGAPALVDLTDLPAPEPLEHVLAATARLPPGQVFIARVPRVPQLLLARLAARPELRCEVHEEPDGLALLRISHAAAPPPGAVAR